jgi:hypothetical protein
LRENVWVQDFTEEEYLRYPTLELHSYLETQYKKGLNKLRVDEHFPSAEDPLWNIVKKIYAFQANTQKFDFAKQVSSFAESFTQQFSKDFFDLDSFKKEQSREYMKSIVPIFIEYGIYVSLYERKYCTLFSNKIHPELATVLFLLRANYPDLVKDRLAFVFYLHDLKGGFKPSKSYFYYTLDQILYSLIADQALRFGYLIGREIDQIWGTCNSQVGFEYL